MLSAEELTMHIDGCAMNNRESQKKIYSSFYGYAMAVCDRYTKSQEDAVEILNDGFLKIFKEVHRYKPAYSDVVSSFKGWLRKIMVYTAIDHFRKNQKYQFTSDLDNGIIQVSSGGEDALDRISYEEIIRSIQDLTPGYRTVLNLFIIEGFTHEEISEKLGISIGTSKSNLAKARRQLQKILFRQNQIQVTKNVV
ncbi:MAG: RNA polymerase sigma factor [Chitinophagales bacterium]